MGTVTPLFSRGRSRSTRSAESPAVSLVDMGEAERETARRERDSAARAALIREAMRELDKAQLAEQSFHRLLSFPVVDDHLLRCREQLRAEVDTSCVEALRLLAEVDTIRESSGGAA